MWWFSRSWRRRRWIRRHPLSPDAFRRALERVPMFTGLSAGERRRLHDLCVVFLREKTFEGCGGIEVDDAMRLHVAAQACLLILEHGIDAYAGFTTILVYPREFRSRWSFEDEHGTVVEEDAGQLGESWPGGPVILSWADALPDADADGDGFNLVVHEFAHKLDELDGEADGVPPQPGLDVEAWRRDFEAAMAEIARQEERGFEPSIDSYACENLAEAFAVFSEHFFETPDVVAEDFPEVYGHLRRFYRQDPVRRARRAASRDRPAPDST